MTDPLPGPDLFAGPGAGRVSTQSQPARRAESCARWGTIAGWAEFDTDDPDCPCRMCAARRKDRERAAKARRKK